LLNKIAVRKYVSENHELFEEPIGIKQYEISQSKIYDIIVLGVRTETGRAHSIKYWL
jgi:hypothetical protein